MNDFDGIDLRPLRDAHWAARADRLADHIAARLGSAPRDLPAPLLLAFEAAAGPVLVAAAAVILVSTAYFTIAQRPDDPLPTMTQLIAGERAPTAANVYLALRGYQP